MASCGMCHSKKKKIDLMIQNVELLRLRLSQQEKLYYTNLFYDYSENDRISQKAFPKLLGMLGTDIAENFADRIFETFALNKDFISLYEYLKYIDIYHYGDEDERCKVTCRLMDYDSDNKISFDEFRKYIKLILTAVRKVNPSISLDILGDKDIKLLFYKISENKEEFTYNDFGKVYREKPELVSWIDYFKNNDTDILVVINENIRTLLQSMKEFFSSFSLNLKLILQENGKSVLDLSVLNNQIKTFCQTVDKKQKKFLEQIVPFNIRSVFDKLINNNSNQEEKKNIKAIRNNRSSAIALSQLNEIIIENQANMLNDIQISSDPNPILTDPSAQKNKDIHYSKDVNRFFNKFKSNLADEQETNSILKNEGNVTIQEEEDNHLNNGEAFKCKGGNITSAHENRRHSSSLLSDSSNMINTEEITLIVNGKGNKSKKHNRQLSKEKDANANVHNSIKIEPNGEKAMINKNEARACNSKENNKLLAELLNLLSQFGDSAHKVTKNIDESYRWIKKSYLRTHIQKAKQTEKKKTIKRCEKFTTINVPKKLKAPKKQYLIKTPDQSFKILLNMIMGIQIAVQSTPNYDINPDKDDFTNYLNNLSYSIQTTNFGQKKQESFYIKEYAGIIFNNIRKLFGFNKESFISSISPQDFITEIMVSSQTIFEELCSTGKSGSLFYYTRDGKFILKTIGQSEYHFLKKILPNYFKHIKSNPYTLLPKFLGCYQLVKKVKKDRSKFYFLIMMNIFSTSHEIHVRYDLKGSLIGRRVLKGTIEDNEIISKGNFALKDLDFDATRRQIIVGERREIIIEQLRNDAEFLSRANINDYSLLFGAHVIAREEKKLTFRSKTEKDLDKKGIKLRKNATQVEKIANIDLDHHSVPGHAKNTLSLSKNISDQSNLEASLSVNVNSVESNNDNMAMVNLQRHPFQDFEDGGLLSDDSQEIYYIGIIDILTEYNCLKHTEHFFKMAYYCSQTMSCVDPLRYKNRFLEYLERKIVDNEKEHLKESSVKLVP